MDGLYDYGTLSVSRDERLMTVALNRPETRNAIDVPMSREVTAFFRAVTRDESVGSILLRGEGRSFCAGGDVGALADEMQSATGQVGRILNSKDLLNALLDVQQPVVTAVQGHAMGLGATVALASDVVVAAEDALFADSHIKMGLVPGDGGAVLWPLLLPLGIAKYHLLTGAQITGAEAARVGMIYMAVPADRVLGEATKLAGELAAGPTMALRWTKVAMNRIIKHRVDLCLEVGLALEGATLLGEDFKEAVTAFKEKRPPHFTGG